MASMRDINRAMEREIAKGSCPLKLDKVVIGKDSYYEVTSREKLHQVSSYLLRVGEYSSCAGKTVANNVYMDTRGRKTAFKRTRNLLERKALLTAAGRRAAKYEPGFCGDVFLERAGCTFTLPDGELEKYKYTYLDKETYAFTMSDRYILGLYTLCLAERRNLAAEGVAGGTVDGIGKEYGMMKLTGIKDVLFQCLLLDDVQPKDSGICANLYTIYLLTEGKKTV